METVLMPAFWATKVFYVISALVVFHSESNNMLKHFPFDLREDVSVMASRVPEQYHVGSK
jgi:hypothetical protein